MKLALKIWTVIFSIILLWIYFIFISPKIFHNKIVSIPDIASLNEAEGLKMLDDQNINYQITYIENDVDAILKTIPYAGTKIKASTSIKVYIGKIMPEAYKSFLGQSYEDSIDKIELMCNDKGITLKVEYEENTEIVPGIIIKESLTDGSLLNKGDTLIITVSSNSNSFLMPKLVGLNIEEALKIINEYNIKVNIIYYQTPIDEDVVIFQSTPPKTIISKVNSYKLDIYVSKGLSLNTHIDVSDFIDIIPAMGYELEIIYVNSNLEKNILVEFEVQKIYDIGIEKYILWVSK